jgi:hypothetical protein
MRIGGLGQRLKSRMAAALAVAAGSTMAVSVGIAGPAGAAAGGSILSAGQQLQAGQELVSVGGQYQLAMQTDGNLVIYGNGCVVWASNTAGTGSHDDLSMQTDGNLVIYTSAGKAVWASGTAGTGGANSLNMQADGNLVVYTGAAKPVWASGAGNADQLCAPHSMGLDQYIHSAGGRYELLMQDDGNLVLYGPNGATWASNTVGSGGTSVNLQGDGNLVIYTSAARPVWASDTAGTGSGNHLVMQDDGNLVIYASAGKPVWASNTAVGGPVGSVGSKIASIAAGQEGVQDNPANTYCNPYTAYWGAGTACGNGLRREEWCADFAAWAWRQAGVGFTYGWGAADINGAAASFYRWAIAEGTWHAGGSGYAPQPGDVAVYGRSAANASHVGIVVGNGSSGPDVVNGDWTTNGNFPTEVYYRANESSEGGVSLVGYASPS